MHVSEFGNSLLIWIGQRREFIIDARLESSGHVLWWLFWSRRWSLQILSTSVHSSVQVVRVDQTELSCYVSEARGFY